MLKNLTKMKYSLNTKIDQHRGGKQVDHINRLIAKCLFVCLFILHG